MPRAPCGRGLTVDTILISDERSPHIPYLLSGTPPLEYGLDCSSRSPLVHHFHRKSPWSASSLLLSEPKPTQPGTPVYVPAPFWNVKFKVSQPVFFIYEGPSAGLHAPHCIVSLLGLSHILFSIYPHIPCTHPREVKNTTHKIVRCLKYPKKYRFYFSAGKLTRMIRIFFSEPLFSCR